MIGAGRFDLAVCSELVKAGVDALRLIDPGVEARVLDWTDEDALRAGGVFDRTTLLVKDSPVAS